MKYTIRKNNKCDDHKTEKLNHHNSLKDKTRNKQETVS